MNEEGLIRDLAIKAGSKNATTVEGEPREFSFTLSELIALTRNLHFQINRRNTAITQLTEAERNSVMVACDNPDCVEDAGFITVTPTMQMEPVAEVT